VLRSGVPAEATVPGRDGFVFDVALPAPLFDEAGDAPHAQLAGSRPLLAYDAPTPDLRRRVRVDRLGRWSSDRTASRGRNRLRGLAVGDGAPYVRFMESTSPLFRIEWRNGVRHRRTRGRSFMPLADIAAPC
jgi:hypothetical protein